MIRMPTFALRTGFISLIALTACQAEQKDAAPGSPPNSDTSTKDSLDSQEGPNTGKSGSKAPFFKIVKHEAKGGGCRLITGEENATAIIKNSYPDGPKDYALWTFDDLAAPSHSEHLDQTCELTLTLAWTPGYRVISQGLEMELWANGPMDPKLRLDLRFSNRSPSINQVTFTRLDDSTRMKLAYGEKMSSDCSGRGTWRAKFDLSAADKDHEQSNIKISQASVLFELFKLGGFEDCIERTVPPL